MHTITFNKITKNVVPRLIALSDRLAKEAANDADFADDAALAGPSQRKRSKIVFAAPEKLAARAAATKKRLERKASKRKKEVADAEASNLAAELQQAQLDLEEAEAEHREQLREMHNRVRMLYLAYTDARVLGQAAVQSLVVSSAKALFKLLKKDYAAELSELCANIPEPSNAAVLPDFKSFLMEELNAGDSGQYDGYHLEALKFHRDFVSAPFSSSPVLHCTPTATVARTHPTA